MEKYNLKHFENKDEAGNKLLLSVGVDDSGNEVAQQWACDRPDCDCVGKWYSGNESQVEKWYERPTEI